MKASKMIKKIQELIEEKGDLDITVISFQKEPYQDSYQSTANIKIEYNKQEKAIGIKIYRFISD